MLPISIPFLTPDDRPWRIDWFGELSFPGGTNRRSQPCVRTAISPVLCNPADHKTLLSAASTECYEQRQRWLPIGMLPYIQVGDIWQNKRHLHTPNYQQVLFKEVEITRETTNFIKAGLSIDNEFILPLNQHPWHRQQTQSYCISAKLANEKRIVIPCMEMIRFYFGSSSSLLHRLFSSQIGFDFLWKAVHLNQQTGHLHLKLANGISGASASDIGRIALNQDARHAARMIFDTCLLMLLPGNPVYPYTGFPFTGKTDLIASGKWLSYGAEANSTFIVYRLESCSHPFPFLSLTYEATDSQKVKSKKHQAVDQASVGEEQKAVGKSPRSGKQTLAEGDPGKSRSGKEIRMKTKPRFPDLASKAVWRERYDTVDAPALLLKGAPEDEQVSVGSSHGNTKVRSVDVVSQASADISAYEGKLPRFVRNGIKVAIQNAKLGSHNISTSLITLPGYSNPVISLPHLVDEDGEIDPVSFCLDSYGAQRPRRGCFVEIKEGEISRCQVFIVEGKNAVGVPILINVQEFDLKLVMGKLLAQ